MSDPDLPVAIDLLAAESAEHESELSQPVTHLTDESQPPRAHESEVDESAAVSAHSRSAMPTGSVASISTSKASDKQQELDLSKFKIWHMTGYVSAAFLVLGLVIYVQLCRSITPATPVQQAQVQPALQDSDDSGGSFHTAQQQLRGSSSQATGSWRSASETSNAAGVYCQAWSSVLLSYAYCMSILYACRCRKPDCIHNYSGINRFKILSQHRTNVARSIVVFPWKHHALHCESSRDSRAQEL